MRYDLTRRSQLRRHQNIVAGQLVDVVEHLRELALEARDEGEHGLANTFHEDADHITNVVKHVRARNFDMAQHLIRYIIDSDTRELLQMYAPEAFQYLTTPAAEMAEVLK